MKIGILTVPFNNNYGGFLQAYALKSILLDLGHEVIFINRRRDKNTSIKGRFRDFIYKITGIAERREKKIKTISVNTDRFRDKYLTPITEEFYSSEELGKCNKMGFDCYIVGSDQVWRYKYAQKSISDYFFNFVDSNVQRFSYAASFGTDVMEYPPQEIPLCSNLLTNFSFVSVREASSVEMLKKVFAFPNAVAVLDPTLLLNVSDYEQLFDNLTPPDKPYILSYILDDNTSIRKEINGISLNKSVNIIDVKAQTGDMSKLKVLEPIEKWLMLIANADLIITDSFHGTIFSILFNRPFITLGNNTRGMMRFEDLLSQFGLMNRLVYDTDSIEGIANDSINWIKVNSILNTKKHQSVDYLRSCLNACKNGFIS